MTEGHDLVKVWLCSPVFPCASSALQFEVLAAGGFHLGLGVVGRRHLHRQRVDHALDRAVLAVGQGDEGLEGILHLALGDDPVGPCGIVAGQGLQHVGLVGQADVKPFVGLFLSRIPER